MVATIAFGMGIDKPDVLCGAPRFTQNHRGLLLAGRAGATAPQRLMIYGLQDVIKLRQMMQSSQGSEQHKRIEQHRLNAMLGLWRSPVAAARAATFGETASPAATASCLAPAQTGDATEACRMAPMRARTGALCGTTTDVLKGKETDKIWQFDHLSPPLAWGRPRHNQWRSVFRQLVGCGYLSVDFKPWAHSTYEKCRLFLRGECEIALRDQKQKCRANQDPAPEDINGLWEALRDCRRELADFPGVAL